MVGVCESGGVVLEWLVACYEMSIWLWVWLFVGVLWMWVWVWVFGQGYGSVWLFCCCRMVFMGVSSFCWFLFIYLMDRNCLYYFNVLYVKIGDMI